MAEERVSVIKSLSAPCVPSRKQKNSSRKAVNRRCFHIVQGKKFT